MEYNANTGGNKLLKGCKKGNSSAQAELYRRFYSHIMNYCLRYTSNKEEAVEVLNDVFLKVFTNIKTYKADGSLAGWIRKIAFHTVIDHIRHTTRYREVIELDDAADVFISNDALEIINAKEILTYIQQIPPASRNVFSLYVLEGYKHHEIAQMLHISVGTSKWHLTNAKRELQKIYTKNNNFLIAL